MIEDHEIEIVIRDTNNNVLKVDKVPARSARATIYVQVGNLTMRAFDVCPRGGKHEYIWYDEMQSYKICQHCGKRK